MTDQPSSSGDSNEPERPSTIPDDFIWDPENEAWYAPGEPSFYDRDYWKVEYEQRLEERRQREAAGERVISVPDDEPFILWKDPPTRPKTRGAKRKSQTRMLWDDDAPAEGEQPASPDPGNEESAEDVE